MPAKSSAPGHRANSARGQRKKVHSSPASGLASRSSTPEINVGRRLRALRDERDLSARVLAEKSSLAVNTLSLIETGKTSPSVSTLQQIAYALDVPITEFFETDAPKSSVAYVRAAERPRAAFAHGTLEDLGAGITHRAVEPFVVTLEPNMGSGPNAIVHTGYEFVYCLQGRIAYTIEERTYLLEAGDSVLFESHLPHRWHNVDTAASRAILVLYPTDERDHPTERHFTPKEAQQ
ncbi:MAG: cupin domain-containing protein [Chloroflexi bacterium]|nr:cupin domain-containing protein [Chloroflexota bacterium]